MKEHSIALGRTHFSQRLFTRALSTLLSLALVLSVSSSAWASGRVVWKSTTVKENVKRESWKVELEIHLDKAPDVAYVPMKFEFQQTAHFERSLVDGKEGPQEMRVPLTNQQALIESVDVGFLDAGTGLIQKRTKFSFKITRAHDFQAGEWKVTIKEAASGKKIGGVTNLKLTGENPVVDRRSIVFHGKPKPKKKAEPAPENTEQAAPDEPEESEPEATEPEETESEEGSAPPAVEERPGGGCHHTPEDSSPAPWGAIVLMGLIGAGALARRYS